MPENRRTMKHDGAVRMVEDEESVYICSGEEWVNGGMYASTEDDLPRCTSKRDGKVYYVGDLEESLVCKDGEWEEYAPEEEELSSSSEGERSSSSERTAKSSSSRAGQPEGVKRSGYYDCDEYNCVSTEYLNQDMLDDGEYGEILDTRDDQVYKVVTIGSGASAQTWMAQNLNYNYNKGTAKSYCYGDDPDNCAKYGRLYTWEAAMNDANCAYGNTCSPSGLIRGVCPEGWHLPSHGEFETLINYIDPDFGYGHTGDASSSTAGEYLRATSGWNNGGYGEDTHGFSALPGGVYGIYNEDFKFVGLYAYFWSSTEYYSSRAYNMGLNYDNGCGAGLYWNNEEDDAMSVRCLKD